MARLRRGPAAAVRRRRSFATATIEIGPLAIETSHPLGRLAGKSGWSLKLGRDQAPPGLVQIVHVSTGAADHLAAEIVLDDDAQASIVETFIGEGWTNRLTAHRARQGRAADAQPAGDGQLPDSSA